MQYSVISTRITCLWVPTLICGFFMQNSTFRTRLTSLYGSQTSSVVLSTLNCELNTRIKDYIGTSPHLWLLHAKQRVLDPNNKSLWSQTSPVILCMQYGGISTRITCLYGSQSSSVVLCMQNSDFRARLTSLYGSQTSSVVLSTPNSMLSTRINRLYWFQPSPVVFCMQNSDFRTRITSLCGSKIPPVVFACKTATSGPE